MTTSTGIWIGLVASSLTACGGDTLVGSDAESRSATVGGAQDIGEFRKVVQRGEVPSLELLDEVGFFNEHALDLPPADCGQDLCFHPMLAVAPRFDGGNWSMAFVAANTSVSPEELPAIRRHVVLLVEHSTHTATALTELDAGARAVKAALGTDDLFSTIVVDEQVSWLAQASVPEEVRVTPLSPSPNSAFPEAVDLYSGLTQILSVAEDLREAEPNAALSTQVLLVTSGHPAGITDGAHFEALAGALARERIVVSTFGVGVEYRREVPALLAAGTSGNYVVAQGADDLAQALESAAQTSFVSLAEEIRLEVTAEQGYEVGASYGAPGVEREPTRATLLIPRLLAGSRSDADDVATGRRGGGGGFFVQLEAEPNPDVQDPEMVGVYRLAASYADRTTGARVEQNFELESPWDVGGNPPPTAPFFSDPARAKPFMMLNLYLALRITITLLEGGDCAGAAGIRDMMTRSYENWRERYDDPDIDADYELLTKLSDNIALRCREPAEPRVFVSRLSCFWW